MEILQADLKKLSHRKDILFCTAACREYHVRTKNVNSGYLVLAQALFLLNPVTHDSLAERSKAVAQGAIP